MVILKLQLVFNLQSGSSVMLNALSGSRHYNEPLLERPICVDGRFSAPLEDNEYHPWISRTIPEDLAPFRETSIRSRQTGPL